MNRFTTLCTSDSFTDANSLFFFQYHCAAGDLKQSTPPEVHPHNFPLSSLLQPHSVHRKSAPEIPQLCRTDFEDDGAVGNYLLHPLLTTKLLALMDRKRVSET